MKKTLFLLSLVLGLSSSIFAESLPQATKWYGVVRSEMYSWVAESLGKDNAIGFKSMTYYMEGDTTKLKNNLYAINTSTYQERLKETVSYYINKFSDGNK